LGTVESGIRSAVRAGVVETGADTAKISVADSPATIHIQLKLRAKRAFAMEGFATVIATAAATFFVRARRSSAVSRKSLSDISRAAGILSRTLRTSLYAAFSSRASRPGTDKIFGIRARGSATGAMEARITSTRRKTAFISQAVVARTRLVRAAVRSGSEINRAIRAEETHVSRTTSLITTNVLIALGVNT